MTPEQIAYLVLHTPVQHGFLAALLALAPLVAKLFGGAESARTSARAAESAQNAKNDTLALNRAEIDSVLTDARQSSAKRNALLEGVTDYSATRPAGVPQAHATGGLRPSAIAGGSAMGKQFKDADLAALLAGTPQLTPNPQPNGFDKFLNIAGGIAGALGLAGQAKNALAGASDAPNVSGVKVNSDPNALVNTLPKADMSSFDPSMLPPQPSYKPKFTPNRGF